VCISARYGACPHDLTALAPCVAGRADGSESASRGRQFSSTGQGSLPRGLTGSIDIKDDEAASLPIEDAANGFCGPAFCKALLLEERAEGL
jgi:hypothetical protein